MIAENLKVGYEFKLKGQRKFKTIASISSIKRGDKFGSPFEGKVLIYDDNYKELVLNETDEVMLNIDTLNIPDEYICDTKHEKKGLPIKSIVYNFYPFDFHPCQGLTYWFRWGKYIFDIREIEQFYDMKIMDRNIFPITQSDFDLLITKMFSVIHYPFNEVLRIVYEARKKAGCENRILNNTNSNDDLPF